MATNDEIVSRTRKEHTVRDRFAGDFLVNMPDEQELKKLLDEAKDNGWIEGRKSVIEMLETMPCWKYSNAKIRMVTERVTLDNGQTIEMVSADRLPQPDLEMSAEEYSDFKGRVFSRPVKEH